MASRKVRTRRGRKSSSSVTTRRKFEAAERLVHYIDGERLRLMRATSVLDMMRIVMEKMECQKKVERGEPCLSDVIPIARDAVSEAINRLDSLALRPFIEGFAACRRQRGA